MSNNNQRSGAEGLGYRQAVNVDRRTWDKETYEAKAKARLSAENSSDGRRKVVAPRDHGDDEEEPQEFVPAAAGAAGPGISRRAFLRAREHKVDLDGKVGTCALVAPPAAITDGVERSTGAGWHCKVCDCVLKDSHTYLDHINGRKHQRALGYTMRAATSTAAQVRDRMADLARQRHREEAVIGTHHTNTAVSLFEDVVRAKDEEALRRKAERSRKREARKQQQREEEERAAHFSDGEEEEDDGGLDPAMAAMMGFSGFGSGNKNR